MTTIRTVYNANVYMDGTSHAGKASEVTLPDLKAKMLDHNPISGIGSMELPIGLEKMGMKIKWNTVDADVLAKVCNFFVPVNLMIRSNSDTWVNSERTGSAAVVATIRAKSKTAPPINIKHQDNVDIETEFSVTAYKLEIGERVILDVDIEAQVCIIDGVDVFAQYRENLGI